MKLPVNGETIMSKFSNQVFVLFICLFVCFVFLSFKIQIVDTFPTLEKCFTHFQYCQGSLTPFNLFIGALMHLICAEGVLSKSSLHL